MNRDDIPEVALWLAGCFREAVIALAVLVIVLTILSVLLYFFLPLCC